MMVHVLIFLNPFQAEAMPILKDGRELAEVVWRRNKRQCCVSVLWRHNKRQHCVCLCVVETTTAGGGRRQRQQLVEEDNNNSSWWRKTTGGEDRTQLATKHHSIVALDESIVAARGSNANYHPMTECFTASKMSRRRNWMRLVLHLYNFI